MVCFASKLEVKPYSSSTKCNSNKSPNNKTTQKHCTYYHFVILLQRINHKMTHKYRNEYPWDVT